MSFPGPYRETKSEFKSDSEEEELEPVIKK